MKNILVIEDDASLCETIVESLQVPEWKIIPTHSSTSALLTIKNYEIDVVLTDLHLPSLRGLDIVWLLEPHRIPTVIISGDIRASKKDVSPNIVAFLDKPINLELLKGILLGIFNQKAA